MLAEAVTEAGHCDVRAVGVTAKPLSEHLEKSHA
jgi:hypothetical protein